MLNFAICNAEGKTCLHTKNQLIRNVSAPHDRLTLIFRVVYSACLEYTA